MTPAAQVVLVAPRGSGTARGVLDLLRDWSALGLVQPFVWVDDADLLPGRSLPQLPASAVRAGAASRRLLGDLLADPTGAATARLVVLSAPGADAPAGARVARARLAPLVEGLRGAWPRTVALHCVVPLHGRGGWGSDAGWDGWHTVVVAPEEAWHAGSVPEVLTDRADVPGFLAHAAAAVARLAGMWTGMAASPLDGVPPPPGGAVVVARAFSRRLDAADVAGALRARLVDLSDGLPRARDREARVAHSPQPTAAAEQMAGALMAKHAALFRRRRAVFQPELAPAIGAWAALAMLFRFLWAALRGAPGRLFRRLAADVKGGVAARVSGVVFGADPAYRVVVGGRDASGRMAALDDLVAGTERMAEQLRSVDVRVDLAVPALAPFWHDFVAAGLTLADAGARDTDLPPATWEALPASVREPGAVAAAPAAPFALRGRPAQLVAPEPVAPYDVRAVRGIRDQLGRLVAQDPFAAPEADAELARLEAWAEPVRTSYAGRVGVHLTDYLLVQQQDVEGCRRVLAEVAQTEEADPSLDAEQERQGRVQRQLAAAAVAAVAAVVVLLVMGVLSTWLAPLLLVMATVSWLAAALSAFTRLQRALFRALHRRRQAQGLAEVARSNLADAVSELHLAGAVYRQYLEWAPLLGVFVNAPFGSAAPEERTALRLSGTLPRSAGLGRARVVGDSVDRMADALGTSLFQRGWLSAQWEQLLADAPARLRSGGFEVAEDPSRLYGDPAADGRSPLRRWRAALEADGVGPAPGDRLWARAGEALDARGTRRVTELLLSDVAVLGQQAHGLEQVGGAEFTESLLDSLRRPGGQSFDLALFRPQAQVGGAQRVRRTVLWTTSGARPDGAGSAAGEEDAVEEHAIPRGGAVGVLDQVVVAVQLTGGVSAADLTLLGGGLSRPPAGAPAAPLPPPPGPAGPPPSPAPQVRL